MNRQAAMGVAREMTFKLLEHQELRTSAVTMDKKGGEELAEHVSGFYGALVSYFENLKD